MSSVKIKRVPFDLIKSQGYRPEPHTVILDKDKPQSVWWACLNENEEILCVVCVVRRKSEVHFARTYTPPEYRHNGYCTTLLQYLSACVYPEDKLTAHCLPASVGCYSKAGFRVTVIKQFKHSKMYYMTKEGRNHDS